jgi:hypothetical protein
MKTLIIASIGAAGCTSAGAHRADPGPALSALTVTNQRTEPATIYLVRNRTRQRRLGDLNGLRSASFVLNANDTPATAELQFLAVFSVTGLTELSDDVASLRGVTYAWTLAPMQGQQTLTLSYWPSS